MPPLSSVPENPLAGISIAQYTAQLRRGQCSAVAVTDAFLRRIETLNAKLGAFTYVAAAEARAAAQKSIRCFVPAQTWGRSWACRSP